MSAIRFVVIFLCLSASAVLVYLGLQKLGGLTNEKIESSYLTRNVVYTFKSSDFLFEFDRSAAAGSKSLYITNSNSETVSLNIDRLSRENLDLLLNEFWIEIGNGQNGGKLYSPSSECKYVQVYFPLQYLQNPDKTGNNSLIIERIDCREELSGQELESI